MRLSHGPQPNLPHILYDGLEDKANEFWQDARPKLTSVVGTFETCRPSLRMSGIGGGTEVIERRTKRTLKTLSGRPSSFFVNFYLPGRMLGR